MEHLNNFIDIVYKYYYINKKIGGYKSLYDKLKVDDLNRLSLIIGVFDNKKHFIKNMINYIISIKSFILKGTKWEHIDNSALSIKINNSSKLQKTIIQSLYKFKVNDNDNVSLNDTESESLNDSISESSEIVSKNINQTKMLVWEKYCPNDSDIG